MSDLWNLSAERTRAAAETLFRGGFSDDCVNRAYYAVYKRATSLAIRHGDAELFPNGWNNPSHEQLPSLVRNHGSLEMTMRRRLVQILRFLRTHREDSDYRPGRTIETATALAAVQAMNEFFRLTED